MTKIFLIEYNVDQAVKVEAKDIDEAIDIFRATEIGRRADIQSISRVRETQTITAEDTAVDVSGEPDWAAEPLRENDL